MPRLKDALILAAELETAKGQVEALRVTLTDLAAASEVLLRETNPMTPAWVRQELLTRRAGAVLRTYTSDQVRLYYERLAKDGALLDFIEGGVARLQRDGVGWLVDLNSGGLPLRHGQGPLRRVLTLAMAEEL